MRLPHFLAAVSAVAGLALVLLTPFAVAQGSDGPQRQITISAEGRAAAIPDMATIRLGVVSEAESAADAVADMGEAAGAMLAALEAAGIAPRDLQTSGLSLSPRFRRVDDQRSAAQEIVGYVAETEVTARVRDLDTLGGVLDTVVAEGANRFRGLSFGLSDPDPVRDEARRAAVAEGLRRAELYAEAAGVQLGPLVSLSEVSVGRPQPIMRAEMALADSASVPVAQGEVSLAAQVTLTFEIVDP